MSPLEKARKEAIIRRISFLEIELEDPEKCRNMTYQTYHSNRMQRRNIERIAENITNAVLDIGKIVLAEKTIEIPGTYAEIFDKIEEAGFITEQQADILRYHVRTRHSFPTPFSPSTLLPFSHISLLPSPVSLD